eukprot:767203-Hanusia_phi.AAC.6
MSEDHSSPSKSPGISPEARSAFMSSRKPELRMLLSSKMKQMLSPLHPARFMILRRSSSKSACL